MVPNLAVPRIALGDAAVINSLPCRIIIRRTPMEHSAFVVLLVLFFVSAAIFLSFSLFEIKGHAFHA